MIYKPFLLDVNTLIALTWPNHVHHTLVHSWFHEEKDSGWATCPITQCAFVRISSNPAIIPDAVSPVPAKSLLEKLVQHTNHFFWPDNVDFAMMDTVPASLFQGHRQVTDAYLLLLAEKNEGTLATLDARLMRAAAGSRLEKHITLIPAV